ncbi:MAG: trehalose-phosphatase [Actinomycetota bacterium]
MFLDYDGTLTPIVSTPDLAILSDDMKAILKKLVSKYTVSIISGRSTDDVRSKVNIGNIYYAGSHGFEIIQPDGKKIINEEANRLRKIKNKAQEELKKQTRHIKGALIEDVKYTASCHYRLVPEEHVAEFKEIVKRIVANYPELKLTEGKKVLEVRPNIDWDKGKAVNWILDALGYDPANNLVIYVGDDRTDEDAFAVIKEYGFGILVAEEVRPTEAKYKVKTVNKVKDLLSYFVELAS